MPLMDLPLRVTESRAKSCVEGWLSLMESMEIQLIAHLLRFAPRSQEAQLETGFAVHSAKIRALSSQPCCHHHNNTSELHSKPRVKQ